MTLAVKRNALTEWLGQIKKMSKAIDYISLDAIDQIISFIWIIDKRVILKHRNFFNRLCSKYHKPNPVDIVRSRKRIDIVSRGRFDGLTFRQYYEKIKPGNCSFKLWEKCNFVQLATSWMSEFVEYAILRCEKGQESVTWQWFEVIDFMFERPELVNPAIIDEYIEAEIKMVCSNHKKNNPLENGIKKRLGKYFRDESGRWKKERRKRF